MVGFLRRDAPTGVPKKAHVDFAESLVTGISRPLTNDEEWVLYWFETHANMCDSCHKPYGVYKSGQRLCSKGHTKAIDVADLFLNYRGPDKIYSHTRDHQEIRVEIPSGYVQVRSLLKAVQHAAKHGHVLLRRPKSFDRHYYVAPRPTSHYFQPREHMASSPMAAQPHATIVVEPMARRRHRPRRSNGDSSDFKRGSLFDYDMADLEKARKRESRSRYNLEVREPSFHRHSMYA